LPLELIIFAARVEHRAVSWHDMERIAAAAPPDRAVSWRPLTEAATEMLEVSAVSNPPALVGIDQRPVFEVRVRDKEAFQKLDAAVCGYGVMDLEDLTKASRMFCVNCRECVTHVNLGLHPADIEDRSKTPMEYYQLIDSEDEASPHPVEVTECEGLWAFRCFTDEAMLKEEPKLPGDVPVTLETWPGVKPVLSLLPASGTGVDASLDLQKEAEYLERLAGVHGGPEQWKFRARAALMLLKEASEELEEDLKNFLATLRQASR
jgi:hypothetical protein